MDDRIIQGTFQVCLAALSEGRGTMRPYGRHDSCWCEIRGGNLVRVSHHCDGPVYPPEAWTGAWIARVPPRRQVHELPVGTRISMEIDGGTHVYRRVRVEDSGREGLLSEASWNVLDCDGMLLYRTDYEIISEEGQ